jgi:hypothetical protein
LVLSITLIPLGVAAQSIIPLRYNASDISAEPNIFIYKEDGNYPMDHWVNPDCTNPVILNDKGNATIRLKIGMPSDVYIPAEQGDILNAGGYLTSVTYKASWQNNQTINLYSGNSETELNFNLTNIPYGSQHIDVYASCVVLLFDNGFSSTYPVSQSGTHSVNFTVAPNPTPTPASTPTAAPLLSSLNLEQTALIMMAVVLAVTVIAVVFYRRQQNSTTPKGLQLGSNNRKLGIRYK